MDDLISRQAAIEAVEILLEQTEEDADVKTWNNAIRGAINSIKHHVPSAQQVRTQMSSADDLISRQDVMHALEKCHKQCCREDDGGDEWMHYETTVNELECIPSAQPERETAKFIRWMECKKTADYISYTPHCKCSKCGTEFLIENIKYCYMCGARMKR